jgi:hypothetical protein
MPKLLEIADARVTPSQTGHPSIRRPWLMPRRTIDHRGLYVVPRDLCSAIQELDAILPRVVKVHLAECGSVAREHRALATWIRNVWGLWGQPIRRPMIIKHTDYAGHNESGLMRAKSSLRDYFFRRGFEHPEGISGCILNSYRMHLRGVKQLPVPKLIKPCRPKRSVTDYEIPAFIRHIAD